MEQVWTVTRKMLPGRGDYAGLRQSWRGDVVAGLTVGVVALPLALAFGITTGLGATAGLITAIVAGLVAGVFGGSNVQVSGPTGAMTVVLVPLVARFGVDAVAIVGLLAGIMVVLAAMFRLGRLVSFIPWPVIEGFTLGIAVIIFLQQVPLLTSPTVPRAEEHSSNAVVAAAQSLAAVDWAYLPWALAAVAIVTACMVFAPRIRSGLPGSLIG